MDPFEKAIQEVKRVYFVEIDRLKQEIEMLKQENSILKKRLSVSSDKLDTILSNDETKSVLLNKKRKRNDTGDEEQSHEEKTHDNNLEATYDVSFVDDDEKSDDDVEILTSSPMQHKKSSYVYETVERRKDERQQMLAYSCSECQKFYQELGGDDPKLLMDLVSRHRCHYKRPDTPPEYWKMDWF